MNAFLRGAIVREAVNSVAIEHATDCDCATCRAANGDQEAFETILRETYTADSN